MDKACADTNSHGSCREGDLASAGRPAKSGRPAARHPRATRGYLLFLCFMQVVLALLLSIPLLAQEDAIGDIIEGAIDQGPERPPIIVIDPGHGGKDSGAIGYKKIKEKDVVLQISKQLAAALVKKTGAKVILTRNDDRFITLEGRDAIAVKHQADAFISVHANAAERGSASGIEIYYLNNASDEASKRLSARENKGSPHTLSELESILSTMLQNESTELSVLLAEEVKKSLANGLQKKYSLGRLQIKSALFYVLVGSKMSSILLETGFVTHATEAQRLGNSGYQRELAEAVAEGIVGYFQSLKKRDVNI